MLATLTPEAFSRFATLIRTETLPGFLPELLLILAIAGILVADLFLDRRRARVLGLVALGVSIGVLALVARSFGTPALGLFGTVHPGSETLVAPMLLETDFSRFFEVIFALGTAVTCAFVLLSRDLRERSLGELFALLLAATLGCFIMCEANNLLMVFIGIELLSIPSYALVGWHKRSRASSEAALKYVIYGSVASGFMLYGFSLLYGMTGTLDLQALRAVFHAPEPRYAAAVALLLAFCGFGYKLAAVPLHFWAPDVYQGAPTAVTAWLSVTSKAAGVAVFCRFVDATGITSGGALPYDQLIALIAAVTMTLGNLAALKQTDMKRMLAYSSVAHVGYILMGVAAFDALGSGAGAGWHAVAFYAVAYLVMNLGAFGCVILLENQLGSVELSRYRAVGYRAPLVGLCLTVCILSLIGIPPSAGFSGKFQLFYASITHGMTWLAVLAGLNTAISVGYYGRVIKTMYFETTEGEPIRFSVFGRALVLAHALAVLYLGVFFGQLLGWAQGMSISS